jgi:hypothetical protein
MGKICATNGDMNKEHIALVRKSQGKRPLGTLSQLQPEFSWFWIGNYGRIIRTQ